MQKISGGRYNRFPAGSSERGWGYRVNFKRNRLYGILAKWIQGLLFLLLTGLFVYLLIK